MSRATTWCTLFSIAAFLAAAQGARAQTAEIDTLLDALDNRATEWQAAAQLQALGEPAIAALIANLRTDGYRPNRYGNHSPTMRVLEKIGAPAATALDRVLTPQLLRSGNVNDDDRQLIRTATLVLAEIGSPYAVPVLLRIALTAENPAHRELAFDALVWPAFDLDTPFVPVAFESRADVASGAWLDLGNLRWRAADWDACLGRASDVACPFDRVYVEEPRAGVVIQPYLGDVLARFERETEPRVRLAAAHVLALWGAGATRRAGETELIDQATTARDPTQRERAIRALGVLAVADGAPALAAAAAAAASDALWSAAVEALAALKSSEYIALIDAVITSETRPDNVSRAAWAIQYAGVSQELAFVPSLIERLDRALAGNAPVLGTDGSTRAFELDALWALQRLTFQDIGPDPRAWREWWARNRDTQWRDQVERYVERTLPLMDAETDVRHPLVARVADVDDPAVVPLLRAHFGHPRVSVLAAGLSVPGLESLLSLVRQGSLEARSVLYDCAARPTGIMVNCARAVAVFDRDRALEALRSVTCAAGLPPPSMAGRSLTSCTLTPADALARLGDNAAIPALIEKLAAQDERRPPGFAPSSYRSLTRYTQIDIPYDVEADVDARRTAIERWRAWWPSVATEFSIKTKAAAIDELCCLSDAGARRQGPYLVQRSSPRLNSGNYPMIP